MKGHKAHWQGQGANGLKKAEGSSNPSNKEENSLKLPKILDQISLVHFKK